MSKYLPWVAASNRAELDGTMHVCRYEIHDDGHRSLEYKMHPFRRNEVRYMPIATAQKLAERLNKHERLYPL